jgi:hypothetical protein
LASALIERSAFIRRSDRIKPLPSSGGVAPATIDVLPPCGTSGTFCCAASATTAATSAVLAGARIAAARPCTFPRQSVSHGSISCASVTAARGPGVGVSIRDTESGNLLAADSMYFRNILLVENGSNFEAAASGRYGDRLQTNATTWNITTGQLAATFSGALPTKTTTVTKFRYRKRTSCLTVLTS